MRDVNLDVVLIILHHNVLCLNSAPLSLISIKKLTHFSAEFASTSELVPKSNTTHCAGLKVGEGVGGELD